MRELSDDAIYRIEKIQDELIDICKSECGEEGNCNDCHLGKVRKALEID